MKNGKRKKGASKPSLIQAKGSSHVMAEGQKSFVTLLQASSAVNTENHEWDHLVITHADLDHISQQNLSRLMHFSDHGTDCGIDLVVYPDDIVIKRPIGTIITPPLLGERILRYFCTPAELEGVVGDLEEIFQKLSKPKG